MDNQRKEQIIFQNRQLHYSIYSPPGRASVLRGYSLALA